MTRQQVQEISFQLYDRFAQIGKALGSARRLELIDLLAQSEYTVDKLAEETGMSVANTSQHLKTLRTARLVEVRRSGVIANYRLAVDDVLLAWHAMRRLGEDCDAEVERLADQLLRNRSPRKIISFADLRGKIETKTVLILDVRPAYEYAEGHIQGAHSIPLEELSSRLPDIGDIEDIGNDREIIVYCRGPYSTLSDLAVSQLLENGYKVRRLESGFPEWRAQGLPVE